MTWKKITYLYCDGFACPRDGEPYDIAPSPLETVESTRERAREFHGWTYIAGNDYCDQCSTELTKQGF